MCIATCLAQDVYAGISGIVRQLIELKLLAKLLLLTSRCNSGHVVSAVY